MDPSDEAAPPRRKRGRRAFLRKNAAASHGSSLGTLRAAHADAGLQHGPELLSRNG
jgi:hypothetical protein